MSLRRGYQQALPAANREKVEAIMKHLVAAFEELCNESEEPVAYLDAAMGCHNFHKAILFDLVDRTEMPPAEARVFLTAMDHTFREAIEREIARRSH